MSNRHLTPELLQLVAERFKALAEPNRLLLLQSLKPGGATVSELVDRTGLTQANVSKHLQVLLGLGFVERAKEGLFARYRLADKDVLRLCDLMCGRLDRDFQSTRRALGG